MKERRYKMDVSFSMNGHTDSRQMTNITIIGKSPKGHRLAFELNEMPAHVVKRLARSCITALQDIRNRSLEDINFVRDVASR